MCVCRWLFYGSVNQATLKQTGSHLYLFGLRLFVWCLPQRRTLLAAKSIRRRNGSEPWPFLYIYSNPWRSLLSSYYNIDLHHLSIMVFFNFFFFIIGRPLMKYHVKTQLRSSQFVGLILIRKDNTKLVFYLL